MSAKSAMYERFKDFIVPVPKSMRPTQESIEKLGRRISAQIRANRAMRHRSEIEASKRVCCKGD